MIFVGRLGKTPKHRVCIYNVRVSETLLQTKLYIPQLRPSLVRRPRLIENLNQGLNRKLTLVSAPPGYGKTTLIANWLSQLTHARYGWVTLDVNDNEPSRFLSYLTVALQSIDAELGLRVSSLLGSPELPPMGNLITLLVNDLTTLPQKVVVVFDDYHVIDNLEIHNALKFLLDHQPPQLHLVIISQADPPFPLARLRVHEQVTDIRADDLRFTRDEATAFLNDRARLRLTAEDVITLETRTEGWIAGLQLAALSLKGRPNKSEVVANFAGSQHHVIDYLSEDVLRRQPQPLQTFLLRTSILDRLSGPLCDAVTGKANSQVVLETLQNQNLFLTNQDDKRQWYRYHSLFADFLRIQLHRREADLVAKLHHRAAQWYEENGFISEAVDHALSAEDFQFAGHLVERMAEETLWRRGQWLTLLQWTEALPDEVIYARPMLSLYYAWALFTTGQLKALEQMLPQVEQSVTAIAAAADRPNSLGEIATLRACVTYERGDMEGCIEMARQALTLLAEVNLVTRAAAKYVLALAYLGQGDWRLAGQTYQESIALAQAGGNVAVVLMASGSHVQLLANRGYLHRAAAVYRQARQLGELEEDVLLGTTGVACLGMGDVLREWNDLEAAEHILREGIQLCRQQISMPEAVLEGTINLARVLLAKGDTQGMDAALRRAEEQIAELRLRSGDMRPITSDAVGCLVRLLLATGKVAAAAYWFDENWLDVDDQLNYRHQTNNILLARLYLSQGRASDALDLLEKLTAAIDTKEQPRITLEALILKALAWQALGDAEQAAQTMARALSVAESEGYIRLFVDEGEPVRRLLETAEGHDFSAAYVSQLLAALPEPASNRRVAALTALEPSEISRGGSGLPPFIEPLNERELAILRLMAVGLSNQEIADAQFLALNTIKWYSTRIYNKLNVSNRLQAAARAQELGII